MPSASRPDNDQWSALRIHLHLTNVLAGQPCPTESWRPANRLSPDFGFAPALGPGPVYPVFDVSPADGVLHYGSQVEGGWYFGKVLWVGDPSYHGPILVRGRQIDGPNVLGFETGPNPDDELRLTTEAAGSTPSGWNNWATYTRVRAPGCYAYEVDGVGFSEIIVFQAAD